MWMDPPLRTPNLRFSPPSSQCERSENTASGSPLGGCVGVQHSGALHPCPNRVHAGHHGLFFHTTPAPLDALVDAKHQNAPLRSLCFFLSLSLLCVSILLSWVPSFSLFRSLPRPPLLLRLFDRAVTGAKWCGLFHLVFRRTRASQSKQKMWHAEGEKGELSASGATAASHVSDSTRIRRGGSRYEEEQR